MLNKILCVDDSHDIRSVLKISLEMIGGFNICLCASGEEALEKAAEFAPDLILLDVIMPDMNGTETLEALRQQPELISTPVIFMTGKSSEAEINALMALGAIGVLSKPFQPTELAQQINTLWQAR
ncbi:MAG: response regulator [Nitrincola sp.]|nr:response regulator [Nitrincola sp.]